MSFRFKKATNVFDTGAYLQVRIQRQNEKVTKSFPRTNRGYKQALAWRDKTIQELGPKVSSWEHLLDEETRHEAWQAASRTGVKRIGITYRLDGRSGERSWAVTAHVPEAGRTATRSFSIPKYGLQGAVVMALNTLWTYELVDSSSFGDMLQTATANIKRLIE